MATHVCIIPTDLLQPIPGPSNGTATKSRRILRLPHPRTGLPALFAIRDAPDESATESLFEVQAVAPDAGRSWFLSDDRILSDGKLLVFTPFDALFLVIAILLSLDESSASQWRPLDDMFEDVSTRFERDQSEETKSAEFVSSDDIMVLSRLGCVSAAMERCCETKHVTEDISVYKYSPTLALRNLRAKVDRLAHPVIYDSFQSFARRMARDGLAPGLEGVKEELRQDARIRGSCETLSQFLPPLVYDQLLASYDFTTLDSHIKLLEATDAPTAIGKEKEMKDAKSKATTAANDKKAKAKSASQGVKQLRKASTQGMAKLNTFFAKPKAK